MTSRTLPTYDEWRRVRPGASVQAYEIWIARERARAERTGEEVVIPDREHGE